MQLYISIHYTIECAMTTTVYIYVIHSTLYIYFFNDNLNDPPMTFCARNIYSPVLNQRHSVVPGRLEANVIVTTFLSEYSGLLPPCTLTPYICWANKKLCLAEALVRFRFTRGKTKKYEFLDISEKNHNLVLKELG